MRFLFFRGLERGVELVDDCDRFYGEGVGLDGVVRSGFLKKILGSRGLRVWIRDFSFWGE